MSFIFFYSITQVYPVDIKMMANVYILASLVMILLQGIEYLGKIKY